MAAMVKANGTFSMKLMCARTSVYSSLSARLELVGLVLVLVPVAVVLLRLDLLLLLLLLSGTALAAEDEDDEGRVSPT